VCYREWVQGLGKWWSSREIPRFFELTTPEDFSACLFPRIQLKISIPFSLFFFSIFTTAVYGDTYEAFFDNAVERFNIGKKVGVVATLESPISPRITDFPTAPPFYNQHGQHYCHLSHHFTSAFKLTSVGSEEQRESRNSDEGEGERGGGGDDDHFINFRDPPPHCGTHFKDVFLDLGHGFGLPCLQLARSPPPSLPHH
jgi:hypothetical protein